MKPKDYALLTNAIKVGYLAVLTSPIPNGRDVVHLSEYDKEKALLAMNVQVRAIGNAFAAEDKSFNYERFLIDCGLTQPTVATADQTYKIVRGYMNNDKWPNETIATGLTLKEAQAYCRDPETTSSKCKEPENVQRTVERGPWFDGFEEE